MTIKGLKTAFKKANKRADKAFARYEKCVSKLYVTDYAGRVKRLQDEVFRPDGTLRDFATNVSDMFYRKARNGHIYIKPCDCNKYSPCTWCLYCDGSSCDHSGQPEKFYCRDYRDLRKLESEIDAAVDEREKLLWQLDDLGVDVYRDDELWQ